MSEALQAHQVEGIGLAGQMHGVVLCDRAGTPLRPAILWPDRRSQQHLTRWHELSAADRARLSNPDRPGDVRPHPELAGRARAVGRRARSRRAAAQGCGAGRPHRRPVHRPKRCVGDAAVGRDRRWVGPGHRSPHRRPRSAAASRRRVRPGRRSHVVAGQDGRSIRATAIAWIRTNTPRATASSKRASRGRGRRQGRGWVTARPPAGQNWK